MIIGTKGMCNKSEIGSEAKLQIALWNMHAWAIVSNYDWATIKEA
jgi:hypothetical protein